MGIKYYNNNNNNHNMYPTINIQVIGPECHVYINQIVYGQYSNIGRECKQVFVKTNKGNCIVRFHPEVNPYHSHHNTQCLIKLHIINWRNTQEPNWYEAYTTMHMQDIWHVNHAIVVDYGDMPPTEARLSGEIRVMVGAINLYTLHGIMYPLKYLLRTYCHHELLEIYKHQVVG